MSVYPIPIPELEHRTIPTTRISFKLETVPKIKLADLLILGSLRDTKILRNPKTVAKIACDKFKFSSEETYGPITKAAPIPMKLLIDAIVMANTCLSSSNQRMDIDEHPAKIKEFGIATINWPNIATL